MSEYIQSLFFKGWGEVMRQEDVNGRRLFNISCLLLFACIETLDIIEVNAHPEKNAVSGTNVYIPDVFTEIKTS